MTERRTILLGALAAPALLAACAEPAPQQAAAPTTPTTQAPGWYRTKVGSLNVVMVDDGFAQRPVEGFVINKPLAEVQGVLRSEFLNPTTLRIPYTLTYVETARGWVVFDTGYGVTAPNRNLGHGIANARAAGIDPARVSTVVISHVHQDHINGLEGTDGLRAFPNAEVVIAQTEWRWWSEESNRTRSPEFQRGNFANVARRFQNYTDRMRVIRDNGEVMPGIRAVPAHGHTPGHTCFIIADGREQLMYMADCTNRPNPLALHPDWHILFDFDAQAAERGRRRIYDMVSADRMRVTGYHFPFPGLGHVRREGQGYRFHLADYSGVA
jgi:glyoxylase-like metal-dependent hydrolase (beta-lactamase superfamily II)